MSMLFDPESLMFQTDWEPVADWMKRRAAEKGLTDWEAYSHAEEIAVEYVIDQLVTRAAEELGWHAGQSLAGIPVNEHTEYRREEKSPERKLSGDV
jgi:hypothetical protein